jgi:hypothetical protein
MLGEEKLCFELSRLLRLGGKELGGKVPCV